MRVRSAHVDSVGALFVVCGGLTTAIGLSTLALAVGAVALITSGTRADADEQLAAGLLAAALTTLALIAIVWGIAHMVVGVPLGRRRAWARLAALMLGSVDLLLLPYGTVVGAYALRVLLDERGKKAFEEGVTPPQPAASL